MKIGDKVRILIGPYQDKIGIINKSSNFRRIFSDHGNAWGVKYLNKDLLFFENELDLMEKGE
jgi:hypothetical protein